MGKKKLKKRERRGRQKYQDAIFSKRKCTRDHESWRHLLKSKSPFDKSEVTGASENLKLARSPFKD
jgi:hypothetical protein